MAQALSFPPRIKCGINSSGGLSPLPAFAGTSLAVIQANNAEAKMDPRFRGDDRKEAGMTEKRRG